jgi:hypothetical protein
MKRCIHFFVHPNFPFFIKVIGLSPLSFMVGVWMPKSRKKLQHLRSLAASPRAPAPGGSRVLDGFTSSPLFKVAKCTSMRKSVKKSVCFTLSQCVLLYLLGCDIVLAPSPDPSPTLLRTGAKPSPIALTRGFLRKGQLESLPNERPVRYEFEKRFLLKRDIRASAVLERLTDRIPTDDELSTVQSV